MNVNILYIHIYIYIYTCIHCLHVIIRRHWTLNLPHNSEYMPPEKYNSYGYSASGEIYALGEVVSGGMRHFQEGDMVGLICDLDHHVVTFYINTHQVGEVRHLSKHMEYSPFVVLGNGKFKVTINRVPNIAKLFALKQRTSADSKQSRDAAFVDPNAHTRDTLLDTTKGGRPESAHLFDRSGRKKDGNMAQG